MWITYGSAFILSAIIALLFGSKMGAIIVGLLSTVGLFTLIFVYDNIYKKYEK